MLRLAATALVIMVYSGHRYTYSSCFALSSSQLCMFLLNLTSSVLIFILEVCNCTASWNVIHSSALCLLEIITLLQINRAIVAL